MNILVTGATGNIGGSVVRSLLEKNYNIRSFTRNSESPSALALKNLGIEVVKGDYSDYESLVSAMMDMDTVFAVTTPFDDGAQGEIQQGLALADAAKKTNIGHFIYSSVGSADKNTGIPHFDSKNEIEKYIISIGLPYTISGPVF
ncbi:MAG: NmrA family NAD(P)-binding protein, partial [Candidatus Neomarinimicrobiota bacterium]